MVLKIHIATTHVDVDRSKSEDIMQIQVAQTQYTGCKSWQLCAWS